MTSFSLLVPEPTRTLPNTTSKKARGLPIVKLSSWEPHRQYDISKQGASVRSKYGLNYWTNNTDSTRIYYAGVPSIIQAARHFYIEAALLELFAAMKVFGWMSSMNCARMYNYALARRHAYISNNRCAFDATLPQAFDEEFSWHERNKEMEGIGQEAYPHACDLCFIIIGDNDSKYHQALKDAYFKPAKALFQLRARLKRAGVTLPLDSVPSSSDSGSSNPNSADEDFEVIVDSECDARATFFGSEAVSAVNEFAKAVFPTATSTHEYFIFDNNCKLRAHQDAIEFITWGLHYSDVKFHGHFDAAITILAGISNAVTTDQHSALDYQNSPFLQDAGITVSPDPILVTGRVLPMPNIHYGNAAASRPVQPQNGSWNVINQIFHKRKVVNTSSQSDNTVHHILELKL
ncbi:hypothetical protein EV424DRAFT_1347961 [Suillus variegatus]|nr:hypothetical protein EV424DRAFT_1347961 [Suillus variegatus]